MAENERATSELAQVTLAVIAGGGGRRMGMPKAWLRMGEETVLAWLHRRLQWPGPTLLVSSSATSHPPDASLFDRQCLDAEEGLGPLSGVLAALEHSSTEVVAAIAVDMPAIERPLLAWLSGSLAERPKCKGLMSMNEEGRIEPFPSVFRTSAAPFIADQLKHDQRSVHGLCQHAEFLAIRPPPEWNGKVWTNLNDAEQLKQFQANQNFPRDG